MSEAPAPCSLGPASLHLQAGPRAPASSVVRREMVLAVRSSG